ncbi:MAG TPA: ArsA-related P-loop ATPase [Solirubrobacteraceae bacterium]|nr:ArsA-related P-loop ATPase [Solirubrobacteraceae bacterium]
MGSGDGLAAHLAGRSVVICVGAGGVGKTTTSAALALGLARGGRKVAVVTIDPARRLATALGLDRLSDEPHRIADADSGDGELWAMMLDPKRALDGAIARLAPDEQARAEIIGNAIYRELSGAVAGSQELSAIVKLYELHEEHDFDVLVLDTPPSRNALDFLDAPARLLGFLEGRALQIFLAPSGLTARVFGRGSALLFGIFARVTGVDLLADLSTFFASMSTVLDGFGERTRRVEALLREPSTAFVIVTSPEAEPAREAVFLARRLAQAKMGAPRLVVNRFQAPVLDGVGADRLAAVLSARLGAELGGRIARSAAATEQLALRDRRSVERLSAQIGGDPVLVPQLAHEVQDLDGLAEVAALLFA